MKTLVAAAASVGVLPPVTPTLAASATTRSRLLDFVALTKPRIGLLVLFTVAIGALLTYATVFDVVQLLHALVGTALVASGASALNQWLERHTDAQMRRTENRPLPARRLTSGEVVCFGIVLSVAGLGYM